VFIVHYYNCAILAVQKVSRCWGSFPLVAHIRSTAGVYHNCSSFACRENAACFSHTYSIFCRRCWCSSIFAASPVAASHAATATVAVAVTWCRNALEYVACCPLRPPIPSCPFNLQRVQLHMQHAGAGKFLSYDSCCYLSCCNTLSKGISAL